MHLLVEILLNCLLFGCLVQWGKIFGIDSQVQLKPSLEEMLQVLVDMVNSLDTEHPKMYLHPKMWYFFFPFHNKSAVLYLSIFENKGLACTSATQPFSVFVFC